MTQPTQAAPGNDPLGQTSINALRFSVERLRALAERSTDQQLRAPAYPREWTVAQVLSHLGSGAVIFRRRLEDALNGQEIPEDFAPTVWTNWNAKSPLAQRDDALAADAALLARMDAVTAAERGRFVCAMGPMSFDFAQFVGLRVNEHALHTWDIEVGGDPAATIPVPVAELVIDNLELVARFTAKPTGEKATIAVATTDPNRGFLIELTAGGATLTPTATPASPDLELPAEAFARLVYGRLDEEHATNGHGPVLSTVRHVFPGP